MTVSDRGSPTPPTRPWARAAIVFATVSVVALAVRGVRVMDGFGFAGLGSGTVRLVGLIALAAGAGGLWFYRGRGGPRPDRAPDPTFEALRSAATIMTLLALAGLILPAMGLPGGGSSGGGEGGSGGVRTSSDAFGRPPPPLPRLPGRQRRGAALEEEAAQEAPPAEGERLRPPDVGDPNPGALELIGNLSSLLMTILVVGVLLAGVFGRKRRGRTSDEDEAVPVPDAEEMREGLEASLRALSDPTGDAADGISAAYRTLLAALGEAGAPRLPYEAPYEHLHRTLAALGVPRQAMYRLTTLYVRAQFGPGPVMEADREAAAAALGASLDALAAAQPTADVGTA
ncbi:MAG: DUF4129 domain-containing protein [Gemmatimonadetes bacterium]|nr:DUF4129 domain-containing protein [Gemmatimonadota bacterium]